MYHVQSLIASRVLSKPTVHKCVDCGATATCYDHRDYSKPWQVEPVCDRCNRLRGPAIHPGNASTPIAILIDERRELAAKVAGKEIEIAMLLGERDTARRALVEMLAQIEARRAVREAGRFFDNQGELDAKTAQKHAGEGAS